MRGYLSGGADALGRTLLFLTVWACVWARADSAAARPTAPGVFCKEYSSTPECAGQTVSCMFCHESLDPPSWNAFGEALRAVMDHDRSFEEALPDALRSVAKDDSDGDGVSNADELAAGTLPADAKSLRAPGAGEDASDHANPRPYDLAFAYRRASILYCGRSPSFDEMNEFREAAQDEAAGRTRLHDALSACLSSDYWQKKALLRLADKRIKPQGVLGPDTEIHLGKMRPVLGDYYYDYRLWRFVMSNDRDMRELLTADYHVLDKDDGALEQTWALLEKPDKMALGGGQPLQPEYRAGMITTQWFLHSNTMVSDLPRTTAAQAYRAYVGADIAAMEGLIPVDGEPSDVDHKGVKQAACAVCHSTLDPLSYAFAKYEGAPNGKSKSKASSMQPSAAGSSQPTGQYDILANIGGYNADRPKERIPGWSDDAERPYVLGQQVDDLIGWVRVVVASDEFKRNLADIFFRHALGGGASSAQRPEFDALWRSLPDDGFSANRLIHRLVDTRSFGAP
jgi:hypothetical protein